MNLSRMNKRETLKQIKTISEKLRERGDKEIFNFDMDQETGEIETLVSLLLSPQYLLDDLEALHMAKDNLDNESIHQIAYDRMITSKHLEINVYVDKT